VGAIAGNVSTAMDCSIDVASRSCWIGLAGSAAGLLGTDVAAGARHADGVATATNWALRSFGFGLDTTSALQGWSDWMNSPMY
jgi:hypothetical protein